MKRLPYKPLLLCLLFITLSLNILSQNYIKGTVSDSSASAMPFCPMALINASDSSLVKGNMTNEAGEFIFEAVKQGTYRIKIASVGYLPFLSDIVTVDSLHPQITLNNIQIKSASVNLDEVAVSVFKPTVEFKKGTTILNVENNLIASGNTVIELLKRVPGITIDSQNNVLVNGKTGVRFLINGRLQYLSSAQMMNVLNGMSAESIATIELIKNPPARYDAAGTAGLINIVLKKGKIKGFNGNLTNLMGYGKFYRNTSALALNYKSNHFSVFSNFTYMDLNMADYFKFYRTILNNPVNDVINEDGYDYSHHVVLTGNVGLEWDVNSKTTLGINLSGGPNNTSHKQQSKINIPSGNNFPYSNLMSSSPMTESFSSPGINLNAIHKFDSTGTQLVLSVDYTNFMGLDKKTNENRFYNTFGNEVQPMYSNKSSSSRDFKIFTQKLDFTKNFKKNISLEAGIKTSFVNNNSIFELQQTDDFSGLFYKDTVFSNRYNYNEQIRAAYSTVSKSFEKVTVQLGLRAEQTVIDAVNKNNGFTLARNYLNFFPSGSLDYTINKNHSLQMAYSYRIDRPDYQVLNPVKVFWDRLDYRAGNPFLKPEYSHNINVDYNYKGFIMNSFSFIQTNNSFFTYSHSDVNTNVNTDTIANIGLRNNFSYTFFIQKQFKWYNLQFNGVGLYRNFRGTLFGESANSQSWFYSVSVNNEFRLPKNFKIQLFALYNSPLRESLQQYAHYSTVNFSVQKTYFDNKLQIALGFYDAFYKEITKITTAFSDQTTNFQIKNDSRRVRLTVTYKFGKMKIQRKTMQSNEEESKRLNNPGK